MLKPNITWDRDPNGGGFTGRIEFNGSHFKAYALNNGTWAIYPAGSFKFIESGHALSVISAKSAVSKYFTGTK